MKNNIDELMATGVMGLESFETLFFHPTTDMNQAMECVDSLPWDEYAFELSRDLLGHYRATIYNLKTGDKFIGVDDSAPLAICKAILKAKGVDYE